MTTSRQTIYDNKSDHIASRLRFVVTAPEQPYKRGMEKLY